MNVLVTGASGFVGSHVATTLVERGHHVRAMTRSPRKYGGAGDPVGGDVADPRSLADALAGVDVAYYLIHALDQEGFERTDADAAANFARAAADSGVGRIVYLGGLGADDPAGLSPHLRSRRQVEAILRRSGVPLTVLRAAIVVGRGGISWEITRQLVKNLPLMIAPRWVRTRTQPVALADAIRYLVGVLDHPETAGETYEIGGPDAMSYAEMLQRAAQVRNGRSLPIVVVPLLTPRLSSMWISLVTNVDTTTARNLIDSMNTEVVVTDRRIDHIVAGASLTYEEAVRQALDSEGRSPEGGAEA